MSLSPATWGNVQDTASGDVKTYLLGKTIDLGNNAGDRLSNKVYYKGIRYTIRIKNTIASLNTKWCVRVLVVHSPNTYGDPSAAGGKLWMSDTDSLTPVDFVPNDNNNLIKKVNKNRYKVLHDKKHWFMPLSAFTNGVAMAGDRICTSYVKVNKTLRYNTDHLVGSENVLPNIWLLFFIQDQTGNAITAASGQLKYGVRYDEYFKKQ